MRVVGEWLLGDDGISRPVVRITVQGANTRIDRYPFLVDSGADRTVFSASLLRASRLPVEHPVSSAALSGIGGRAAFALVSTALELVRDDGKAVIIRGQFAAFTDPVASDLSILGRDVLDIFDAILSHRRNEVLLLAPQHSYHVSRAGDGPG